MNQTESILLRVAGASPEVDERLRDVLGDATGLPVHYAPIADTNRGFDMQTLGVAVDGVAAAIAAVALYFQLRDRGETSDDAVERAISSATDTVGRGVAPPREAAAALRRAHDADAHFVEVSITTPTFNIDVETGDGIVIISVRAH